MKRLHVLDHPLITHKLSIIENAYIVPGLGDAGERIFGTN